MIISNNNHVISPKFITHLTFMPNTLLGRFIFSVVSCANVGNREQKRYKYEEECDDGNDLRLVRFPCQVPWVIAAKTPSFMSLHPTLGSASRDPIEAGEGGTESGSESDSQYAQR